MGKHDVKSLLLAHLRARRILTWLPAVLAVLAVGYVVTRLLAFAQLFGKMGPHSGVEITQAAVLAAYQQQQNRSSGDGGGGSGGGGDGSGGGGAGDTLPALVPKVLHQIFHNWGEPGSDELPPDWAAMRQLCIEKNPHWEHKMWHSDNSRALIEDEFSWFLSTYDGYRYPIQRVDVMRYFVLRHFGGIYVDLDNGCEESLDALTYLPVFTTDGGLGALSNNIIGGHANHPWLVMLTENLMAYRWNWILPYAIIMYNSGQWYLTAIWEKYHAMLAKDGTLPGFSGHWGPLHRVMMDGRSGADPWVFFNHGGHGGTWGAGDDWFWRWVGEHWIQFVVEVTSGIISLVVACVCCVRCISRRSGMKGYKRVSADDLELRELSSQRSRVQGEVQDQL